ncbi:hypothetical protein [Kosakonia radicincitans]|uniref:hypothetical protein n=1 Tax=Kosakonia radicincitans TaxID=283686 RepID=UPI001D08C804|nr:hypothetical protein [Kosakonia radicincitans]
MGASHWESWEHLFLHEVSKTMPVSVIAEKLERSEAAIYNKAAALGVKLLGRGKGRPWTQAELFLFGRFSFEEISIATGRSMFSVRSKGNELARKSGGRILSGWEPEELSLLLRHNNARVAELTGRSIGEVAARRLQLNHERNNWPEFDPERES